MPEHVPPDVSKAKRPSRVAATLLRSIRLSIVDGVMLIVAAASASALGAEIHEKTAGWTAMRMDAPILAVLAIVLTAVALGSYKSHSFAQVCLQIALGCLGYLSLIWAAESQQPRLLVYWFQASFALTVALPMFARRSVKAIMPRGPRRTFWKKTFEAVVFSFFNLLLVATGATIEYIAIVVGEQFLGR
jgi:hypothetical protein